MFNIGAIVKGVKAGTFRVIDHVNVAGEQCSRLKEVNPNDYSQQAKGSLCLPDDCLLLVRDVETPMIHRSGLVVIG